MHRRELLRGAGIGAGALLAGCLGGAPDDGSGAPATDTPSPTASPSPTPSPSPTDGGGSSVSGTSFDVVGTACGQGRNRATVTFDEHVSATGTIRGSNTCYTAALAAADHDPEADRLVVRVRSHVREGEGTRACGQCVVDIDYEAEVRFDGDHPRTVVVEHDGEEVARAQR